MTRAPVLKIPRISEGEEALAQQIRTLLPAIVPTPQREFPFSAPERGWRFDFAWPDQRIAVEVEGGTWAQGRHNRGSWFVRELEKYNAAALAGWMVLRVTTEMVVERGRTIETAIGLITEALRLRWSVYCPHCRWAWRPLDRPAPQRDAEFARHEPMPNGWRHCQGHNERCSPDCTSDHA